MRIHRAIVLLLIVQPESVWAEAGLRVRGLEGQAALRLDVGRPLENVSLGRLGRAVALNPLESARLNARRIGLASRLSRPQKLARLVAIAQRKLPVGGPESRYWRVTAEEVARLGEARLSRYVSSRTGLCRERAFLLTVMLREARIAARVRYGVIYSSLQQVLGGHAWVEVRRGRRWEMLDPSLPESMPDSRRVVVREQVGRGRARMLQGWQTADYIYVPTRDLHID